MPFPRDHLDVRDREHRTEALRHELVERDLGLRDEPSSPASPPTLLQVGTNELLLDDSVRLAERARDAEVDVVLDVTAGVPHVFQSFVGQLDEADQALDRAAMFITQHL